MTSSKISITGSTSAEETSPVLEDKEMLSFQNLPYDLLLNIAQYLDLRDVNAIQLTCKTLHDFATTRPVYRRLAYDLLRRCRALPLTGFQKLSDLTTQELMQSVRKATRFEHAWRLRAPQPIPEEPAKGEGAQPSWYKVVRSPPNEEVDWLSPITSSYTLCATKSGKVVCWDVQTDACLAEWLPGEKWELWKCRVEFEDRTVFFTMAKVLAGAYDDERVMEFVLMRLSFPDVLPGDVGPPEKPEFSHVTSFKTTGVVMNVFLLDPPARLLSAFVWVSSSNTIGLYVLLDWAKDEFVFIDTGVQCLLSSNWSCILHEGQIVIHSEESDAAYQHFYPLALLREHVRELPEPSAMPAITARVPPSRTMRKRFIFPLIPAGYGRDVVEDGADGNTEPDDTADAQTAVDATDGDTEPPTPPTSQDSAPTSSAADQDDAQPHAPAIPPPANVVAPPPAPAAVHGADQDVPENPFPFPPWYPESAHFVRQWWPTLPGVPRLSCTVVLLASHDPDTHRTAFVLAQHYFRVPLTSARWGDDRVNDGAPLLNGTGREGSPSSGSDVTADGDASPADDSDVGDNENEDRHDSMMRLWYISAPFEVVCVLDGPEEEADDGALGERPRPLVAVDFGHAVWLEYSPDSTGKILRFVTFPAVGGNAPATDAMEGVVRTLAVPAELELDSVETINIDQSQGAVILSVKEGKIYILCYE